MKIVVIGTRGIPNILGGVETHCEELYPRLAAMGHDITIMRRKPYVQENPHLKEYKGVHLCDIPTPRRKSFEAIIHTILGIFVARGMNPDIVHLHAVGPAIVTPLAKLLGLKVVMTNHGPDYNRKKWGKMAKAVIKLGETWGTKCSNRVIVISKFIQQNLASLYGRTDTALIYNGVNKPVKSASRDYLQSLGIDEEDKYILTIGRFVKEKGFHDLIEAYLRLDKTKYPYKLVIAGDSDHPDEYSESLKKQARDAGVVLTGFIKGEKLNQVMTNASLFVLPSYHEGLPIALLEAMSYDLDVLVSNIDANSLQQLNNSDFFEVGNVDDLSRSLAAKLEAATAMRTYDLSIFNWDVIAEQTAQVYKDVIDKK